MANIEDILIKTDRLRESNQKLDEVTASEVFNGVKNAFRTNIDNEQNRALYKQNLKVLQSFEQLINDPKNVNKEVATKGKDAKTVLAILQKFNDNADWYALVMNEQPQPETDTDNADTDESGEKPNGSSDTPPADGTPSTDGAPSNVQEAMDFLADYNELLREDLDAYASKNIDRNKAKAMKQKRKLFKQCRHILLKQGGKSNTIVALYTAIKQNSTLFDSTYKEKGLAQFFSDWLGGKLMTNEEATAAAQKQVAEKANDAIIQCLKVGYNNYNTFVAALQKIAGVQ